jgi:NADPH:quinone reductase-like Zn-dependent oxidoreductase
MRKVLIEKAGGYRELRIVTSQDPSPGADDVVVETSAIGVNFADCVVRMGLYGSARKYVGWPITPGFEFAGRVVATGDAVRDLPAGSPVFGVTRFGAYASHVVAPRHQVFALPDGLGMSQAAGFPTVFLTAWFALCELARVEKGMSVLVHSAAGGVGGALVQLARASGASVVGVVGRSEKVDAVKALGADLVIDKSEGKLWDRVEEVRPEGFDVVCDANGGKSLLESYRHVRPTGKLIVYGFHSLLATRSGRPSRLRMFLQYLKTPKFSPFALTSHNRSVMGFNLSYLFEREDLLAKAMSSLLTALGEGKLKPLPVTEYALDDVAAAHRALESGTTIGKLVLVP